MASRLYITQKVRIGLSLIRYPSASISCSTSTPNHPLLHNLQYSVDSLATDHRFRDHDLPITTKHRPIRSMLVPTVWTTRRIDPLCPSRFAPLLNGVWLVYGQDTFYHTQPMRLDHSPHSCFNGHMHRARNRSYSKSPANSIHHRTRLDFAGSPGTMELHSMSSSEKYSRRSDIRI